MKHPRNSAYLVLFVGCVVLSYVVLSLMSAGCVVAHAAAGQHQQQHSNNSSSTQKLFCAWACQATADAGVVMAPPLVVTEWVGWPDDLSINEFVPFSYPPALHPRAPPATFFARLV